MGLNSIELVLNNPRQESISTSQTFVLTYYLTTFTLMKICFFFSIFSFCLPMAFNFYLYVASLIVVVLYHWPLSLHCCLYVFTISIHGPHMDLPLMLLKTLGTAYFPHHVNCKTKPYRIQCDWEVLFLVLYLFYPKI